MSRWFLYIFFYSLAGYGLEKVFARAVRSEHQIRKCFLLLPLCPVYGLSGQRPPRADSGRRGCLHGGGIPGPPVL